MATILGPDGQPIKTEALAQPQTAHYSHLQRELQTHPTRGLTPSKLASILDQAEQGEVVRQGTGDDPEGARVVPAQLLEEGPDLGGEGRLQDLLLDPRQRPAEVVPEPLEAAADLLHGRPVHPPVEGAE